MNDVAIIIVAWNSSSDLERCLGSIAACPPRVDVQVIVVDNASSDDSVAKVRQHSSRIQLIQNDRNVGFAAANNQAMKAASSRYVFLLNPDTRVGAGAVDALVGYMDAHQHVWAAGPLILNPDGSVQVSGFRFPSRWNLFVEALFLDRLFPRTRLFGSHKELFEDPHKARGVDYVQGSALMVRSKAVQQAGGLDERYFMYFEETDWCFSFKRAGGEVHYAPVGEVVHFGGGAFAHFDERRLIHYHRSLFAFFKKNYPAAKAVGLRAILLLRSLLRLGLWLAIAVARTSERRMALSSANGYRKVIGMLIRGR
jgi:GT2 family glycosyltransferase